MRAVFKNIYVRAALLAALTAGLMSNPVTAPYAKPLMVAISSAFDAAAGEGQTPEQGEIIQPQSNAEVK